MRPLYPPGREAKAGRALAFAATRHHAAGITVRGTGHAADPALVAAHRGPRVAVDGSRRPGGVGGPGRHLPSRPAKMRIQHLLRRGRKMQLGRALHPTRLQLLRRRAQLPARAAMHRWRHALCPAWIARMRRRDCVPARNRLRAGRHLRRARRNRLRAGPGLPCRNRVPARWGLHPPGHLPVPDRIAMSPRIQMLADPGLRAAKRNRLRPWPLVSAQQPVPGGRRLFAGRGDPLPRRHDLRSRIHLRAGGRLRAIALRRRRFLPARCRLKRRRLFCCPCPGGFL